MRINVTRAAILFLVAGFGGLFTSVHHGATAPDARQDKEPLAAPAPGGDAAEASQKIAGSDQKTVNIDEQYRALLKDWERFRAIRKQQPENHNAFQRELGRLEHHLSNLRDSATRRPKGPSQAVAPAEAGEPSSPTGQGAAIRPGGPAKSAHTLPAEEDVQRFLEALDKTHLPGKPLQEDSLEPRKLRHVPRRWIVKVTDMATAELTHISQLLKQPVIDEGELRHAFDRLETLLLRMDNPPPDTAPTKPRAS